MRSAVSAFLFFLPTHHKPACWITLLEIETRPAPCFGVRASVEAASQRPQVNPISGPKDRRADYHYIYPRKLTILILGSTNKLIKESTCNSLVSKICTSPEH